MNEYKKIISLRWAARLIGPILAGLIYYQLDLVATLERLLDLSTDTIVIAAFLSIFTVLIRSGRWHLILRRLDHLASFKRIIAAQFIGAAMGAVTPGKIGEFLKIGYIRTPGKSSTGKLILSTLFERVFDLAGLLLCGFIVISMTILDHHAVSTDMIRILGLLIGVSIFGTIGWSQRDQIALAIISTCRFMNFKILAEKLGRMADYLKLINVRDFLVMLFITLLSWALYFGTFGTVTSGLGIDMGIFVMSSCATFAALMVALPVSISGIGTREAALIYSFSIFEIVSIDAVAVAVALLALNLMISVIGVVCVLYFASTNLILAKVK